MPNVVFVAPYAMDATTRFLGAITAVPDTRLGLVSSDPVERFPSSIRLAIAGHWRTADCLDADQLTTAVVALAEHLGSVDRLVAILENLQVPLGEVRDRLGIPGLSAATAESFRDKARMKVEFARAGVPCARSGRVESAAEADDLARQIGFPFVAKPLAGAGARGTFRIDDRGQLDRWLGAAPPSAETPMVLEEFVSGDEHSFDSVIVDGRLVWHSISRYLPSPLDVLENPWIQWCVLLPRDIDGGEYADLVETGYRAVTALGLRTGLSHMEWFRRADGTLAVSEVGARPPGAQFMTLMSFAHDADMYASWARLAVTDEFDPPPRRYAVGAAYVRAQGEGRSIVAAHGLDRISDDTTARVVEVRLPRPGATPTGGYEGDGHIVVRDESTAAVEAALHELISTIRLECV
jgi:formate-dependent phosphoribosylglycinamide formyltransferase (GAR transformylase)